MAVAPKKYSFWLFVGPLLILALINGALAMLCASLFFQGLIVFIFLSGLKTHRKTRTGTYVSGIVTETQKIPRSGDDTENYEHTIRFNWPRPQDEYFIKHKISSWHHLGTGQKFKIWVDEENPERSILMETVEGFWPKSIILLIFFVAICYSEVQLLKELLH